MKKSRTLLKGQSYKLYVLTIFLFLFAIAYTPFMFVGKANAYGQILSRKLVLSSGVPGASNVTYTFTFTLHDYTADTPPGSMSAVQSLKFVACDTAVGTYPSGTCTAPPGMSGAGNGFSNAAFSTQSGWQGAASFTVDGVGAAGCTPSANVLCAKRTDTTVQTATSRTIAFNTIKNPNTSVGSPAGTSFYVGIYTYSDAGYATLVDFGATASAVVQTLTTNAAVAEVLNFCVGSTTIDNTTSNIANDCTALTGTSINLGTLDTSAINVSPWTTNGGDSQNAVAMVRSNAGNGTVVAYDAIQQSGTNHRGTLRISGATCNTVGDPNADANGNTFTDPCINAAGATQTPFTAGTEMFGMTIAGVNGGSTTSYSCTYDNPSPGTTCDLEPLANYLGGGSAGAETYATTNGFAWDESGNPVNIASSAGSTVKQIDDEALILKYAATPSITTPFGPYAAQTDFIAIPTY
jgi:hypothetical protein